jgi:hypothetical protein
MSTLRTGARTPFFASDITHYHNLSTTTFSPLEDLGGTFSATQEDEYIKNGFLIMNATDTAGLISVITWEEFDRHRSRSNKALVTNAAVLALCTAVTVYVPSGGFIYTPIVKAFTGGTTTVVTANICTVR